MPYTQEKKERLVVLLDEKIKNNVRMLAEAYGITMSAYGGFIIGEHVATHSKICEQREAKADTCK